MKKGKPCSGNADVGEIVWVGGYVSDGDDGQ